MKIPYLATIIFILLCLYIFNTERTISRLKQKNQLQQITIETNNVILKKQSNIIEQHNKLNNNKQSNKQTIRTIKSKIQEKLNNANEIHEKQKLLNNIL